LLVGHELAPELCLLLLGTNALALKSIPARAGGLHKPSYRYHVRVVSACEVPLGTPEGATGENVMANVHGRFVWYELMTTDTQAAKNFYGKVVGWGTQDMPMPGMNYSLFTSGATPIGGG